MIGRQLIRAGGTKPPAENPHEFVEHERLVGVCDACGWAEYDHYTFEAMVAFLQVGLS